MLNIENKTPPELIGCHAVKGFSKPLQTYGIIDWIEPIAVDNIDGQIIPRRFGKGPGSKFTNEFTKITYEAKDRQGNVKRCGVVVHLQVVRCSPPVQIINGYFICHPSTDFVYGGYCRYGCYDGYELHGSSRLECTITGKWSSDPPVCNPMTCPQPETLEGAELTCTNGNYYGSVCTYMCKAGFDMPPHVSKTVVCSLGKTWRKYGQPKCIDVEPPKFTFCPSTVVSGTETGANTSLITWEMPRASDNSGETVIPKQTKGHQYGQKLTAGTYDIVYAAKDSNNNYARECAFSIVVRDVRCSQLYPTPYMYLSCPHGYRTGSGCHISCVTGKILDGSEFVTCNKNPKGLYGEWNWRGGKQSFCKGGNSCTSLSPPKNGAVVCDNWIGGSICQFQCRKGTDMAGIDWRKLHICTKSGDWSPRPIVKACNVVRRPEQTLGVHASYYFEGDCTNDDTRQLIASNFISSLQTSLYQPEACPDSSKCSPQNVQIRCGASDKKRRAIHTGNERHVVTISAELPVVLSSGNSSFVESYSALTAFYSRFEEFATMNAAEIFNTNVTILSIKNTGLNIICYDGAVRSEQSLNCVDCPEGTYFRKTTNTCEMCVKGTYQNLTAQLFCVRCPTGTTTRDVGSASIESCEDSCEPGTFSSAGIQPCSPCENGRYQQSYGQMSCKICPGSSTTLNVGSKSISDCKEFDIVLLQGQRKNITTMIDTPKPMSYFVVSFWLQVVHGNEHLPLSLELVDMEGAVKWSCTLHASLSQTNGVIGQGHEDFEIILPDARWHNVIVADNGSNTLIYMDKILLFTRPSIKDGQLSAINRLNIYADTDFSGRLSQLHIWTKRDISSIISRCLSGMQGDILSWHKFGNSLVAGAFIQIPSVCDDFDNCISSPCNFGKCVDALGGYSCICTPGYTGFQCDINIDDCANNVCMEGATCLDGVTNYTCACPQNITGIYCDIKIVHGGWSDWNNWTECSQTCGEGKQTRRRLCNNPYPDSYGNDCIGLPDDIRTCNLTICPVCPSIFAPENGSIACEIENGTETCNISCNDGFDFDIEPLESYYCGPQTFHIWNFETKENPTRKLPKCTEIAAAEKLKMVYSAAYRDLFCESEGIEVTTKDRIRKTMDTIIKSSSCFINKHCVVEDISIVGCQSNKRQSRATERVGFFFSISASPDNGQYDEAQLQDVFSMIHGAAEKGDFDVSLLEHIYELDLNLTSVSGEVICPEGTTRVKHYCVPCGAGSFLKDDYCSPCPYGSYQDIVGQSSCKTCPDGKTTNGEGSTSETECSISVLKESNDTVKGIAIAIGTGVSVFVLILVLVIYRRMKSVCIDKVEPTISTMFPMSHARKDPLGAANRRFKTS